jgi:hypothetical protein
LYGVPTNKKERWEKALRGDKSKGLPVARGASAGAARREGRATPPQANLYDFDDLYDPDFGSDDDFENPHGDWLDFG